MHGQNYSSLKSSHLSHYGIKSTASKYVLSPKVIWPFALYNFRKIYSYVNITDPCVGLHFSSSWYKSSSKEVKSN